MRKFGGFSFQLMMDQLSLMSGVCLPVSVHPSVPSVSLSPSVFITICAALRLPLSPRLSDVCSDKTRQPYQWKAAACRIVQRDGGESLRSSVRLTLIFLWSAAAK